MQSLFSPAIVLGLLHEQCRCYGAELTRTRETLSSHQRTLAEIELALDQREEKNMSRKDKKKLQWFRALARKSIKTLEWQQVVLGADLCELHKLTSSYRRIVCSDICPPWTTSSITTDSSLLSALSSTGSWVSASDVRPCISLHYSAPPHWDFSISPNIRSLMPCASFVNSRSHENHILSQSSDTAQDVCSASGQSQDHVSPTSNCNELQSLRCTASTDSPAPSYSDMLPELGLPLSPADKFVQGDKPVKRRHSNDAVQAAEDRLVAPTIRHKRGNSADAIAHFSPPPRAWYEFRGFALDT